MYTCMCVRVCVSCICARSRSRPKRSRFPPSDLPSSRALIFFSLFFFSLESEGCAQLERDTKKVVERPTKVSDVWRSGENILWRRDISRIHLRIFWTNSERISRKYSVNSRCTRCQLWRELRTIDRHVRRSVLFHLPVPKFDDELFLLRGSFLFLPIASPFLAGGQSDYRRRSDIPRIIYFSTSISLFQCTYFIYIYTKVVVIVVAATHAYYTDQHSFHFEDTILQDTFPGVSRIIYNNQVALL